VTRVFRTLLALALAAGMAALAACATAVPAGPSLRPAPGGVRSKDFLWDSGGFTLGRATPASPAAPAPGA
jgi:hypothetical protein